ncbi:DUF421 domain-containing protein [Paenibacillus chitinolyticus]|uniref:DUF421 domain-containing protein n=1 Tax=Paenibacillus chitinolyticus TaxID=79263 RepID=UPI002DB99AD3|nr:DUF421 domain-containing protein [Paenibacillus chitinolyticus]MEC0247731.1 DUF421 domain-containing protein [Paenibacillus chitinolyticus]
MELLTIFLRTVMIYFVVFVMLRIMGKREIGKLSVFDLVISIMIAEIAVFVLEDIRMPMANGMVPMITLVLIQLLMAFITLKSQRFRTLFEGRPSVLIEHGKLNREEMRKQRYNLDDLMMQLRQHKVMNVADVEFAILEPSGKLSVVEKYHPSRKPEMGPVESGRISYAGLPVALVMDGKVQEDNLQKVGQTRFWLKSELKKKGIADFKEVFFCSVDHRGYLYVDKKDRV